MYCNPVFIILIKYHRVKETQQISRGKCIINQFIIVAFFPGNNFLSEYIYINEEDMWSIVSEVQFYINLCNERLQPEGLFIVGA